MFDVTHGVKKKLYYVIALSIFFIIAETIGAYFSKSIAIFTDVAHLISDLIGFIISFISVCLSSKAANLNYTYGFIRAEVLGALFSLIIIWGLTIWIMYVAIERLISR